MKYFLITIITVMALVGCGGAEERKSVYLEKAKVSLETGDLDKARIELKNVLQIDPKDARAHFQLGDIYDQKKEYKKAFGHYSKALELAPDNLEYHARIGTYFLLLIGDIDTAIKKRDLILNKDGENVSGLLLKAGILYKQNDMVGAKKISQKILSRQPGHIDNASFLSSLYMIEEKYDDSINALKICIKENPGNQSLLNLLATTYLKAEKYNLAESEYKGILENNPEVFSNYVQLALFYKKIEAFDKAENVLRKAIEENADDAKRKMALVSIIQQTKGNQSAIEELKRLIVNNSNMGELRLKLAKLYLIEKNIDEAEKVFKIAISDFSEDSVGIKSRVHLANLYIQKNDVDAATSTIEEAFNISPNDSEVSFVKAKLQLGNKDYEGAIISLRTVIKDYPESVDAYLMLVSAHKSIGKNEQVKEILSQAYKNNRSNKKGLMALARYHSNDKNVDEAERIVDSLLIIDDKAYEALSLKNAVLALRKNYSESKLYSDKLIKLYPERPNGYLQMLPSLLSENKQEQALSLLKQGYVSTDKNVKILKILTSMQLSMKEYSEAEDRIKQAINERSDAAELHMLLADVYSKSGKNSELEKTLRKIIELKPNLTKTYLILSDLYNKTSRGDSAEKTLKEGLSRKNDNFELSLALANLYESSKNYEGAINQYQKILKTNSDNVIIMNNLAAMLSEHRTDAASLKHAKELADKLKVIDKDLILDTVGWVYYKTGDYADAVKILKYVVEKIPDVAIFNYHLGMALYKSGDEAGAKTYLTKSLANGDNFSGMEDAKVHLKKLQ